MYSQLEKYIKTRTAIDEKTLSYICSYFQFKKTKRNEFLVKEGETCRHYYFVKKRELSFYPWTEIINSRKSPSGTLLQKL